MTPEDLSILWFEQAKLMTRFRMQEAKNFPIGGWTDWPVNFNTYVGEERLKHLSLCFMEELIESKVALTTEAEHEELIDSLHFIVELMIYAGISAKYVAATTYKIPIQGGKDGGLYRIISQVLLANHELNHRLWKKNPKYTDPDRYRASLVLAFWMLIQYLETRGLYGSDIVDAYITKKDINHQRIDAGA